MSLYFDLVINCDLREDISDEAVEAIRSLTDRNYQLHKTPNLLVPEQGNIWDYFFEMHFLAPDPTHETLSNFQRKHRLTIPTENNREVHRYSLQYMGRWLHDDFFSSHHLPFIDWLATVSHDSYLGYYMESEDMGGSGPRQLIADVITRRLKEDK